MRTAADQAQGGERATPQPNEHGVYQPSETLALPNPRPGWKGAPLADIDLLQFPEGWRASIGVQLGSRGRTGPITLRCPIYLTRDAAIAASADEIGKYLGDDDAADARAVARWLDSLNPEQPDLFGAAA